MTVTLCPPLNTSSPRQSVSVLRGQGHPVLFADHHPAMWRPCPCPALCQYLMDWITPDHEIERGLCAWSFVLVSWEAPFHSSFSLFGFPLAGGLFLSFLFLSRFLIWESPLGLSRVSGPRESLGWYVDKRRTFAEELHITMSNVVINHWNLGLRRGPRESFREVSSLSSTRTISGTEVPKSAWWSESSLGTCKSEFSTLTLEILIQ